MRVTDKWQVKKRNEDKHKISNWYRVIESESKNDREEKLERGRQTDIQTYRQRDRQTNILRDKKFDWLRWWGESVNH